MPQTPANFTMPKDKLGFLNQIAAAIAGHVNKPNKAILKNSDRKPAAEIEMEEEHEPGQGKIVSIEAPVKKKK